MGPWGHGMGPQFPMGSRGRPMGLWGQGMGPQCPMPWAMGSRGRPMGSLGVKGKAYRVPGGQGPGFRIPLGACKPNFKVAQSLRKHVFCDKC